MKVRSVVTAVILVLLAGTIGAAAQAEKRAAPARAAAKPAYDFQALMQKIFGAWSSTDPSGVAQYYVQEPGHVYYDIAPLQYNGWQEYAEGYKKLMTDYSSVRFTLGPDARAHQQGDMAWATATWKAELVKKDGRKETLEGRWTAVFEKRGDNWIIVHDHFSVPLPSAAPPKD